MVKRPEDDGPDEELTVLKFGTMDAGTYRGKLARLFGSGIGFGSPETLGKLFGRTAKEFREDLNEHWELRSLPQAERGEYIVPLGSMVLIEREAEVFTYSLYILRPNLSDEQMIRMPTTPFVQ